MYLEAKIQTAKVSSFFDAIETVVVDRQVIKAGGGRPQYTCKIVKGWPGVEDMRTLRRRKEAAEKAKDRAAADQLEQELQAYAAQIQLPQEDQVYTLVVTDVVGKQSYKTLMCELVVPQQP